MSRLALAPSAAAAALSLLSCGLLSCGAKEDVSLSVSATNLQVTKGVNAFGAKMDGSVQLNLELGNYADGSVHVETVTMTLVRDAKVLLGGAARFVPGAGEPLLPLDVSKGQKLTIRYHISGGSLTEPLQLSDAQAKELCAGQVAVSGSVQQQGRPEPIRFDAFPVSVSGCP